MSEEVEILNDVSDAQASQYVSHVSSYHSVIYSLNQQLPPSGFNGLYKRINNTIFKTHLELDWIQAFAERFMMYESRPWFLVNGDTDVLSRVKFTGEARERLLNSPIAVFLYEPLFLRDRQLNFPWLPNRGEGFHSYELERVKQFNENHGGNLDIEVYICEYNFSQDLNSEDPYKNLNIKTFDSFLVNHLIYSSRNATCSVNISPKKKSICLNFRHTNYREIIVSYLAGKEYMKDTYLTFYHKHNPERFHRINGFPTYELPQWPTLQKGNYQINVNSPYTLEVENGKAFDPEDCLVPDLGTDANTRNENVIGSYYYESFCALVNETRYIEPAGVITEKTTNAIHYKKPFVLISSPFCLKYLKELGFKTFGEFWDESYDDERDPLKRMDKILNLIDWIYSKSYEELGQLTEAMSPILEHNFNHLRYEFLPQELRKLMGFSKDHWARFKP